MRHLILAVLLSLWTSSALPQCGDPIIDRNDRASEIQNKMKCFASENERLKQELARVQETLARVQASNAAPKVINTYIESADYDLKKFPPAVCKSKSIDVITGRGGRFISQGESSVTFLHNATTITVNCADAQGFHGDYSVLATITDDTQVLEKLADFLTQSQQIFP